MAQAFYSAPGIHCGGCADSIKRSLGKLPGVENVAVDVAAKRVQVDYDAGAVTESVIQERLAAAGFPAVPAAG